MHLYWYAPLKPLGHPHPSGDLTTATGLVDFFRGQGHRVSEASRLRSRWIYRKPLLWPVWLRDLHRIVRHRPQERPDLFFTYHSYYKSPDGIGPFVSKRFCLPYVVFQGIYSTKRRRNVTTWPGFILNRLALRRANIIFSNRRVDLVNLKRLIPENRLGYIRPGIQPDGFRFEAGARTELRQKWGIPEDVPVVVTAAMFRTGVKADGLEWVIRSCARIRKDGIRHHLVVIGDGVERPRLLRVAGDEGENSIRFIGQVERKEMSRYYSAGDMFVFPGIRETLGMVYLEAQSCGLPVVAFDNGGIPEVVDAGSTGFLTPFLNSEAFDSAVKTLLTNRPLRLNMGQRAAGHVRLHHDIHRNYRQMEEMLLHLIRNWNRGNMGRGIRI